MDEVPDYPVTLPERAAEIVQDLYDHPASSIYPSEIILDMYSGYTVEEVMGKYGIVPPPGSVPYEYILSHIREYEDIADITDRELVDIHNVEVWESRLSLLHKEDRKRYRRVQGVVVYGTWKDNTPVDLIALYNMDYAELPHTANDIAELWLVLDTVGVEGILKKKLYGMLTEVTWRSRELNAFLRDIRGDDDAVVLSTDIFRLLTAMGKYMQGWQGPGTCFTPYIPEDIVVRPSGKTLMITGLIYGLLYKLGDLSVGLLNLPMLTVKGLVSVSIQVTIGEFLRRISSGERVGILPSDATNTGEYYASKMDNLVLVCNPKRLE